MIRPLKDRLVVSRIAEPEKTASGLYIPEKTKAKPLEGIVLSVGSECNFVKTGDRVMFGKYCGTEVKLNDEEYLILKEEDILGVMANG